MLGHHLFVFIHPYFDGNGRIGRFLMNALEAASAEGQITPLAKFIAQEMEVWSPEHENPEVQAWENSFKKYNKKTISARGVHHEQIGQSRGVPISKVGRWRGLFSSHRQFHPVEQLFGAVDSGCDWFTNCPSTFDPKPPLRSFPRETASLRKESVANTRFLVAQMYVLKCCSAATLMTRFMLKKLVFEFQRLIRTDRQPID